MTTHFGSNSSEKDLEKAIGPEIREVQTDDDKALAAASSPTQGRTLLPGPAANLISHSTGLVSFYVRAGSRLGGWGLSAGRVATLKTLSITSNVLESVLIAAGRDASSGQDELGRARTEGLLEKSISTLHDTIAAVSLVASAGFHLTEASIETFSGLAIQSLSTLNAILGCTESSRGVAAIITLMKSELNKPEPDGSAHRTRYYELLLGTTAFVLLQRWGRRKTELEWRDDGVEDNIWDIVVDDRGFRAEVVGTRRTDTIHLHEGSQQLTAEPAMVDELDALGTNILDASITPFTVGDYTELSDSEIRERIESQLPPGARAVISSQTITAKTIKVEIFNANGDAQYIEAPPGTVMIAERLRHGPESDGSVNVPDQTVVFQTALKRSSSSEVDSYSNLHLTSTNTVEEDDLDNEDAVMMQDSPKRVKAGGMVEDPDTTSSHLFQQNTPDLIVAGQPSVSANQKRTRAPLVFGEQNTTSKTPMQRRKGSKARGTEASKTEKSGPIKRALHSMSTSQSTGAIKDIKNAFTPSHTSRNIPQEETRTQSERQAPRIVIPRKFNETPKATPGRTPITSPGQLTPTTHSNQSNSYFVVQRSRRNSIISQTDTYSIHPRDSRPSSPTYTRAHARRLSGITTAHSSVEISSTNIVEDRPGSSSSRIQHSRSNSILPSLYSMATKHSEEAIILAEKTPLVSRKSVYDDHKNLLTLADEGKVPGIFPDQHLITTIRRFSKFASASYGSQFMKVMGITSDQEGKEKSSVSADLHRAAEHFEHTNFSEHTSIPPHSILLSSFYDPEGVIATSDSGTKAVTPLVHWVLFDHDAKAVVLTCRGTLGFEDLLTDATCDYDKFHWRGQSYSVHRGILAAAQRLLGAGGHRIMATIKAALEEYPDYGLVMTGHSLGGAVGALLAILISEPNKDDVSSTSFVTSAPQKLLTNFPQGQSAYVPITLPSGRPIHVYSFGTPAIISEDLRLLTRGLITTIINSSDIIPTLSLGTLHDFRAVALNLRSDTTGALSTLRAKVMQRIQAAVSSSFYDAGPPPPENTAGDGLGEDSWAWGALKTLRGLMTTEKLVPPGEVFVIETTRVFDRLDRDVAREAMLGPEDAGARSGEQLYRALGRPATRVQFKLVRDVPRRFGELRFGRDMFSDHNPKRYESNLAVLEKGIVEP